MAKKTFNSKIVRERNIATRLGRLRECGERIERMGHDLQRVLGDDNALASRMVETGLNDIRIAVDDLHMILLRNLSPDNGVPYKKE